MVFLIKKKSGGLGGTRTHDQCLKRALLYQLSYQPGGLPSQGGARKALFFFLRKRELLHIEVCSRGFRGRGITGEPRLGTDAPGKIKNRLLLATKLKR